MKKEGLSIIIPTFNEAGNIRGLLSRIKKTMYGVDIAYEIIFVDDHSTDQTKKTIHAAKGTQPVRILTKHGKKGKGYSILEGYDASMFAYIAMLDADLQYPPEIIPDLYKVARAQGFAVARRKSYRSSFTRRVASRANAFVFGKLLLNLDTDIQSGLKIFPAEVFDHVDRSLVTPWAIDIPLVHTAYELGHAVGHVDIDFHPREEGVSKIRFFSTAWQIATGAIRTRIRRKPIILPPLEEGSMRGSGFTYKRNKFVTHTTLTHQQSALVTFTRWQQSAIAGTMLFMAIGLLLNPGIAVTAVVAVLSAIYFTDVLFNLYVVLKSLHSPPEIVISNEDIEKLDEKTLPMYSVLCPLYHEAAVLPQFIEAVQTIDWPKDKLEILLLLEANDTKTITAAATLSMPPWVRTIIVPDSQPKTKPKACNYGLSLAKGEYVVIYDAEDKPDPRQLKKAFVSFTRVPKNVVCLQAKLNYYNPHHNLLTRLFTAEYSLWFDVILPGLQSIATTIPLGGTSNHFKKQSLLALQGWDPFNVTEDCDLGARLFKAGYKTAIFDSVTLEEANSDVKNWFRQRSRWIKGYLQTYLVHLRHPLQFLRDYGWHAFIFQLIIGFRITFMIINPILWLVTIAYFTLYRFVGPAIESVYPAPVFYMAAFSLVFGNFTYLYNYMIGAAKRDHWDLIKYVFIVPVYWLMISIGAGMALFQLVFKPHYWEKTIHGLHLTARKESAMPIHKTLRQIVKNNMTSKRRFGGIILVASGLVGNILSFIYNAYLGRQVSFSDFGLISVIGTFVYIAQVPVGAISSTIAHQSAYLLGKRGTAAKTYWIRLRRNAVGIATGISVAWLLLIPQMTHYFHADTAVPFLLFTPVWFVTIVNAVDAGYLSGNLQFMALGIFAVLEGAAKLAAAVGLISSGNVEFVYAAIPLSTLVSFGLAWWQSMRLFTDESEKQEHSPVRFSKHFFVSAFFLRMSTVGFLVFDVLFAKHYLSPTDAGKYSLIALIGKMVFFAGGLFSQFMLPLVSHAEGAGKNPQRTFRLLLGATGIAVFGAFLMLGPLGGFVAPLLWGEKVREIIPLLTPYTFGIALLCLAQTIVLFHQSKKEYLLSYAMFLLVAGEVIGFLVFHDFIEDFIFITAISGVVTLITIGLLHIYYQAVRAAAYNLLDFIGLWGALPKVQSQTTGKLRILIFNWYDSKHIWAGGAEQYIHQIAKRWAKQGHNVTFFAGNDNRHSRYETVDGIRIIRRGGQYTVALWAFLYYTFRLKKDFDVIIDVPKGVPFFTPLYSKKPVICLIHQVHQEMFRSELRTPIRQFSMFLEAKAMPFVYRKANVVAVSPSTKQAIDDMGMAKGKDIPIVFPGVDIEKTQDAKTAYPSVIYLGRLRPYKCIDVLLMAFANIRTSLGNATLTIAGAGEDEQRLREITQKLGLEQSVHFTGKVSDKEKARLFTTHWVAVQPSMVEGWGITNIEANACGTPVVASDVEGLRDSVQNGRNGLLVPGQDYASLEEALLKILTKPVIRKRLSKEAASWAKEFNWDTSAEQLMHHIQGTITKNQKLNEGTLVRKFPAQLRLAFATIAQKISMLI